MLRFHSLAPALALVLAASACGDDSSSDTTADAGNDATSSADVTTDGSGDAAPLPDPLSMPEWCRDSNQVWCDWMFACFSDADMTTARATFGFDNTVEGCHEVAVASCQNRTIPAVNDGRQAFDGQQAALCVQALMEEPCATFDELAAATAFDPPACHDVTVGQVRQAEVCQSNNDCAAENARCIEGLCTGRLDSSSFLATCDPSDASSVFGCPGLQCLRVREGAGQAGICTHACTIDDHCGEGAGCFIDNSGDQFCLALCESDDECGQFSCVQASPERSACIVE